MPSLDALVLQMPTRHQHEHPARPLKLSPLHEQDVHEQDVHEQDAHEQDVQEQDAVHEQDDVHEQDVHEQSSEQDGAGNNAVPDSVRSKKSYEDEEDEVVEDAALEPAAVRTEYGFDPFWHHPCGRSVDLVVRRPKGVSVRRITRHINKALERVWQQLNMSVLHYRLQRFDKLYYKVSADYRRVQAGREPRNRQPRKALDCRSIACTCMQALPARENLQATRLVVTF